MKKIIEVHDNTETTSCEENEDGHYILVNDLGLPQCADCFCPFFSKAEVKAELKKRYGEFWEEEYNKIKFNARKAKKNECQISKEMTEFHYDVEYIITDGKNNEYYPRIEYFYE